MNSSQKGKKPPLSMAVLSPASFLLPSMEAALHSCRDTDSRSVCLDSSNAALPFASRVVLGKGA